jgi:hypothetical protein
MPEYRIDFTITRRREGDEDFTEIGFGSSGAWSDPAHAAEMLAADLQHYRWETSAGMPDPEEVARECSGLDV